MVKKSTKAKTVELDYQTPTEQTVTQETINNICLACKDVESMPSRELIAVQRHLKLDIKLLRSQRKDLQEALAHNQAKVARINKTLLNVGLKLEGEKVFEEMEEILSVEE